MGGESRLPLPGEGGETSDGRQESSPTTAKM